MKAPVFCIALLAAAILASPVAFATTLPTALTDELASDARRLVGKRKPPGLAVAVVVDGQVAWSGAWGRADLESGREMTVDTPFPLGDLSKLYTTALALKLQAAGTLDLDDRIADALPDVRIASRFDGVDTGAITLRQLLSQHAGLPPERWSGLLAEDAAPERARLPPAEQLYLTRPPGTMYGFSNVGYVLAGEWLAGTAGLPFERAVTTHLLDPLALTATGYGPLAQLTASHEKRTARPTVLARDPAPSGMSASAADLAIFLAALMPTLPDGASRLLPAAQTRELFRRQNDDVVLDFGSGIGLGHALVESSRPRVGTVLAMSSFFPDTFADLQVFADHGIAVVVLGNAAGDDGTATFIRTQVDRLLAWRADIPARPDDDDDEPALPDAIDLPTGAAADPPAARYNTVVGVVPVRPEAEGFIADVMGWQLHAQRRADGWHRLSWHLLGFIPIDAGVLDRILVRTVQAQGRRLLLLWFDGRIILAGSTFQAPALDGRWRALAGRYRLTNGDGLTERLKLDTIDLELDGDLLVFRYALPLPVRVRTRIPVVPLGDDGLVVPGFGGTLGEQSRVRFGPPAQIEFAGYVLEREP